MVTAKQQAKVDKRAAGIVRKTFKEALKDPIVQTDPACVKLCEIALEVIESSKPEDWIQELTRRLVIAPQRFPAARPVAATGPCAQAGCKEPKFRGGLFGISNYCRAHQPSVLVENEIKKGKRV